MNYSSRFWLYAPITVFLLIAAGVSAHWFSVANAFRQELAAVKGREALPGVVVDWSSVDVAGFPFRVDADFTGLSLKGTGAHGHFAWTTAKFALHALTYGRPQDVFEAAGQQHLEWTDTSGAHHAADFLPGSLRASAIRDARGLGRFDLDIVDAAGKGFTAGRLQFHMRRDPDGKDVDLMTRGDAVTGFGVPGFQVYATLSNETALNGLLAGAQSWPDAVTAWKAKGGAARITRLVPDGFDGAGLLSALY